MRSDHAIRSDVDPGITEAAEGGAPGKVTRSSPRGGAGRAPVQLERKDDYCFYPEPGAADAGSTHRGSADPFGVHLDVHETAHAGLAGAPRPLPHQEAIQRSFGHHDVSRVEAHVGGPAADAASSLGAVAYATGNSVAFGGAPDLHTAAHEAAHVVQQRGGVSFKHGVGQAGDRHERHADAVADIVVAGGSAEHLLDQMAGSFAGVQRKGDDEPGSGQQVSVAIREIAASHGTDPSVSSELRPMERKLKRPPLNQWNTFSPLGDEVTVVLEPMRPVSTTLPHGNVELLDRGGGKGGQVSLGVTIDSHGKRVADGKHELRPGDPFLTRPVEDRNQASLVAVTLVRDR